MIDTLASAGGFLLVAYVMGRVTQDNIARRKRIEQLDAELSALVHHAPASNVVSLDAWRQRNAKLSRSVHPMG